MVRLEVFEKKGYEYNYKKFQFQYGAIRRVVLMVHQEHLVLSFNSNMVRLEVIKSSGSYYNK